MLHAPLRLHVLRDGAESRRRPYQTSRRHPRTYILASSNSSPRVTRLRIFSRLSTSSLTIAFTLALPNSTVTLRQRLIHVPLLVLHTPTSFPVFLPQFEPLFKRWSLTSNVTPTPTSDSRSSPRLTYPAILSRLSTTILTFLEAVEPNLQRHPYVIIGFTFLSSSYITHHLFPSFYRHFHFSRSGGALPPTSPLHHHRIRIPLIPLPTSTFFPNSLPPF